MKAGEFVEAIERFFLDLVGTVLPGLVLLAGVCYVTKTPLTQLTQPFFEKPNEYTWVLVICLGYILGHGVTSMGHKVTKAIEALYYSDSVRKGLDRTKQSDQPNTDQGGKRDLVQKSEKAASPDFVFDFVLPEKELEKKMAGDPIYRGFQKALQKRLPSLVEDPLKPIKLRTWRNMALSIAQEHSPLVYRFAFISLLNLGVATVCLIVGILWTVLLIVHGAGSNIRVAEFNVLLLVFLTAPYFFLERYYNFNRMALQVPFSMALTKLELKEPERGKDGAPEICTMMPNRRFRIYLAGGFKSNWQDEVMKTVPAHEYLDPRVHGLQTRAEYTTWDLEAIRRSHCIFAYLEATNPGGFALALELGFAKALGKMVILVDQKSAADPTGARYLEMLAAASDATFNSLGEGIEFLRKLEALPRP